MFWRKAGNLRKEEEAKNSKPLPEPSYPQQAPPPAQQQQQQQQHEHPDDMSVFSGETISARNSYYPRSSSGLRRNQSQAFRDLDLQLPVDSTVGSVVNGNTIFQPTIKPEMVRQYQNTAQRQHHQDTTAYDSPLSARSDVSTISGPGSNGSNDNNGYQFRAGIPSVFSESISQRHTLIRGGPGAVSKAVSQDALNRLDNLSRELMQNDTKDDDEVERAKKFCVPERVEKAKRNIGETFMLDFDEKPSKHSSVMDRPTLIAKGPKRQTGIVSGFFNFNNLEFDLEKLAQNGTFGGKQNVSSLFANPRQQAIAEESSGIKRAASNPNVTDEDLASRPTKIAETSKERRRVSGVTGNQTMRTLATEYNHRQNVPPTNPFATGAYTQKNQPKTYNFGDAPLLPEIPREYANIFDETPTNGNIFRTQPYYADQTDLGHTNQLKLERKASGVRMSMIAPRRNEQETQQQQQQQQQESNSFTPKSNVPQRLCGGCNENIVKPANGSSSSSLSSTASKSAINSMIVFAADKFWHLDHFRCVGSCGRSFFELILQKLGLTLDDVSKMAAFDHRLLEFDYFLLDDKAFCPDCFQETQQLQVQQQPQQQHAASHSKYSCARCMNPIAGGSKMVKAGDKTYHVEHFTCFHCGIAMGEGPDSQTLQYYEVNNEVYCAEDYMRIFASTCGSCGTDLQNQRIVAFGQSYCVDCFACVDCGTNLANKAYFDIGNAPVCKHDYLTRIGHICTACNKTTSGRHLKMEKESRNEYGQKERSLLRYHFECLKCTCCGISLWDPATNRVGDMRHKKGYLYCKPCLSALQQQQQQQHQYQQQTMRAGNGNGGLPQMQSLPSFPQLNSYNLPSLPSQQQIGSYQQQQMQQYPSQQQMYDPQQQQMYAQAQQMQMYDQQMNPQMYDQYNYPPQL